MKSPYTCRSCQGLTTPWLSNAFFIVCAKCGSVVYQYEALSEKVQPRKIPDDWSFVQIGSAFQYREETVNVVGRLRFQFRNDYKNFWCGALQSGDHIWLMESFASFAILSSTWVQFNRSANKLRAGGAIALGDDLKLRGEYVEKCEGISYEGEVGEWKPFKLGFFFMQCSNNEKNTAVFTVDGVNNIFYLSGDKVDIEKINLTNVLTWDEWK